MMLYYLALYQGMSMAPAVEVYITHYLWPVFAALFIKMFLGRSWGHKGPLPWIFMLMSFVGAGMVIMGARIGYTGHRLSLRIRHGRRIRNLWRPVPALSFAAGDMLTRRGYAEHAGFLMPYLVLIAAGLVSLAVMSPLSVLQFSMQPDSLTGTLFVGLRVIMAAEMAWVLGVRWKRTHSTTALAYLTPVFSTMLLILITQEHLHPHSALGMALIVGANILMHFAPHSRRRPTAL